MEIQITLDCDEPHELVAFWSTALGYEIEDHTAVVEGLVATGRLPEQAVVHTDHGTGFADLAACRDPEGRRPRMLLQREPGRPPGKLRQHLDLQVGAERADHEVARLVALGATVAWTSADRGVATTTLRDPEGNEFCVS
ncbi:VOC family protein [Nakamurella deserti]|uniref:VOC family protein n=1 Tax=Nakamurella deserti TaxID=2164074 RepID=UPI000DBE16A3|nr:VOC family protein [Nakamurella deserti]